MSESITLQDTPLANPLPSDELRRAERFARDLAWGVVNHHWEPRIPVAESADGVTWMVIGKNRPLFSAYKQQIWGGELPHPSMMSALGYLAGIGKSYELTGYSYELLRKQDQPPKTFISYRHGESSAFALLLEARLRIAGEPNPFVDKNILGGEEWEPLLRERIADCDFFVALMGLTAFDEGSWVLRELEWAQEAGKVIIPIFHNGQTVNSCPDEVKRHQGTTVQPESAAEYEAAVNFILNALGYGTY